MPRVAPSHEPGTSEWVLVQRTRRLREETVYTVPLWLAPKWVAVLRIRAARNQPSQA